MKRFKELESVVLGLSKRKKMATLKGVEGFSGRKLLDALQGLAMTLDPERECYLEVGVFQGMTLLSVAKSNEDLFCLGIDNFSQVDGEGTNKAILLDRAKTNEIGNYKLIEMDFEDAFDNLEEYLNGKKIGLYFVDGPHDYRSQLVCLEFIKPYLSKNAIIVVDDSNYRHVRLANRDFIKANNEFTLFYENYTSRHPNAGDRAEDEFEAGWWDGVNIIVKDTGSLLDKMYPATERKRDLYYNDHYIHSDKYSYLAPHALKFMSGVLDFNVIKAAKGLISCFKNKNSKDMSVHKGKHQSMNVFTDDLESEKFNSSLVGE